MNFESPVWYNVRSPHGSAISVLQPMPRSINVGGPDLAEVIAYGARILLQGALHFGSGSIQIVLVSTLQSNF